MKPLKHQDVGGHANPRKPLPMAAMSTRLVTVLDQEGIWTYGALAELDASDMLDMRGFGLKCLAEVSELLAAEGFDPPAMPEGAQHYPYKSGTKLGPK